MAEQLTLNLKLDTKPKERHSDFNVKAPKRAKNCNDCYIFEIDNHMGIFLCPRCKPAVYMNTKLLKMMGYTYA